MQQVASFQSIKRESPRWNATGWVMPMVRAKKSKKGRDLLARSIRCLSKGFRKSAFRFETRSKEPG